MILKVKFLCQLSTKDAIRLVIIIKIKTSNFVDKDIVLGGSRKVWSLKKNIAYLCPFNMERTSQSQNPRWQMQCTVKHGSLKVHFPSINSAFPLCSRVSKISKEKEAIELRVILFQHVLASSMQMSIIMSRQMGFTCK